MERREFLECVGIGAALLATPATALPRVDPLAPGSAKTSQRPEPSVATEEDVDAAQVEKVYYRHWRRVNRRHYLRVSRRVYRRRYYY
jgi:hypothetical protein